MTIPGLYNAFFQSSGVSIDTRSILEGNIYFALKGDNFNGNKFTQKAFDAGASLAVIDDLQYRSDKTVVVADVLETIQELSKYHREQLSIPVIGLTGSNGKTTTKELIASVLSTQFKVAFTKGNLNNHIGVPLTLLSIRDEHQMAIIEMGANHLKEIEFLCSLCQPDFGYITNFGKAHLEGFGGMEGVIKGKSELYDFIRKHGKKVFVYADDKTQMEKTEGMDTISFGETGLADYVIKPTASGAETISVEFNNQTIQTHLTGNYNFSNVGAAIAMGKYFGISTKNIKKGVEGYIPQNNRSQVQRTDRNLLLVDTYNANPSSMEGAILNFRNFPAQSKWAILGDMFEMGSYEAEEHQSIANLASGQQFEKVLLIGKAFSKTKPQALDFILKFETTDELLTYLNKENPIGKTILLKGSRGMRLERAIELL